MTWANEMQYMVCMYVVRKNKKSWATDWVAAQWQFGDDVGIVWANYSIIHSDGVVSKPWLSNAQGIWHEYVVDFKCIGESRQRCSIHPHATATCYMDLRKECWCVSMGVTMVRNHIPFHVPRSIIFHVSFHTTQPVANVNSITMRSIETHLFCPS